MSFIYFLLSALDEEQAAGKIVYVRAKVAQENVSGSEKQTNASETGSEQKTAQSEASTSEVTAQPTKLIKVRVVPANKRLDPDAAFGDDFFTVKHLEQVVKNNRVRDWAEFDELCSLILNQMPHFVF